MCSFVLNAGPGGVSCKLRASCLSSDLSHLIPLCNFIPEGRGLTELDVLRTGIDSEKEGRCAGLNSLD